MAIVLANPYLAIVKRHGDDRESWQLSRCRSLRLREQLALLARVVESLGGWGCNGVELFVKGDDFWFFGKCRRRPSTNGFGKHVRSVSDLSEFSFCMPGSNSRVASFLLYRQYGPTAGASAVVLRPVALEA